MTKTEAAEKPQAVQQVADDQALLDLMMEDLMKAPPLLQPTNYWKYYEDRLLPMLKAQGLRDFRRSRSGLFNSFGAVDIVRPIAAQEKPRLPRLLNNKISRRIPGWIGLMEGLQSLLLSSPELRVTEGLTPETLRTLYHGYAVSQGAKARYAKPLSGVEMSLYGNPEDVFEIDGKRYSFTFIHKYLRYAFASRHIDFGAAKVIVELGSGSGKQIELLKKLHPDASFLVFDIPPQIYVAHQYLSKVFPDSVVPYRQARELKRLDSPEPGKIYLFGTPQYPLLETAKIDVFWNAASFQEMEPDVVENYLATVNRRAESVYLQELTVGMTTATKGEKGVLKQTTLADYQRYLGAFDMVEHGHGLPYPAHSEMVFRRKAGAPRVA